MKQDLQIIELLEPQSIHYQDISLLCLLMQAVKGGQLALILRISWLKSGTGLEGMPSSDFQLN